MGQLVKINTPISAAKFNHDGFYTCGNYIAVVSFSQHKNDYTVIQVVDQNTVPGSISIVEEVVIKPERTITAQIRQFKEAAEALNIKYENQRNN